MSRLYDRLMRKGYEADAGTADLYGAHGAFEQMGAATVVAADNVDALASEWNWVSDDHNPAKDIPNVVPSLSPAFFEARAHGKKADDIVAYGALVRLHDLSTDDGRAVLDSPLYRPRAHGLRIVDGEDTAPDYAGDTGDARFITESWLIYEPRASSALSVRGNRPRLVGVYLQPSLGDGSPAFHYEHPLRRSAMMAHADSYKVATEVMLAGQWMLFPLYLAMSFMHCKNVEMREVEQPLFERRVWRKKHKRPLVRYHVLDIDPMRKVLRDEGGAETHGLKKALHICRGHFATYTDDAPLFGRLTGTFWKPQHVRGSARSGVVLKDYNVKAPR